MRFSSSDVNGYVIFSDSGRTNQFPMMININSNGSITAAYWNGSANANTTLLSGYAADTTYTFTLTTQPSSGVYSASVSGGSGSLINQNFRHIQSNGNDLFTKFNALTFYNNGGGAAAENFDIYVDNISVTSVPEPAIASLLVLTAAGLILARRSPKTRIA